MRKIILTLAAVMCIVASHAAKAIVERPSQKCATSFAVVIDAVTYDKCRAEVEAYRNALTKDGLAVYIISNSWSSPEEVRSELALLYKSNQKKMPLEGCVFVGDVPYVSVQNAQHMTTAFKMNEERFPIDEASVTSDRFYDDLNLKFEFIKRDSLDELRYYYKLAEDSPQHLNPTFYSGRIHYPEQMGGDKYEATAKYLRKVVAERERNEQIDYMTTFAGAAYNSDCLVTWMDERVMLGEIFPQLNRNDYMALRQLNFRMNNYNMTYKLFSELERDELDIMLFNEHGSPDKQHISGEGQIDSFDERLEALRYYVYSAIRREERKDEKGDVEGAKAYFKERFHLTDKFFEEYYNPTPSTKDPDDLNLDDLNSHKLNPRFVVFNACYNGSFHQPGYVAGSYIFGDGRTVVAQGNTVNVLQDRWTYELFGLLTHGVRIGQYNRMVATLEGHIIGDPAFRFAPTVEGTLAQDMVTKRVHNGKKANLKNVAYWNSLLDAPNADVQSLALRMLADGGVISAKELLNKYRTCNYATTRMECLKLIMRFGSCPESIAAVGEALYDSYEVVRRNAATYAWMLGAEELADEVADVLINYPESQRVGFILNRAMEMLPEQVAMTAFDKAAKATGYPEKEVIDALGAYVKRSQKTKHNEMECLFDNEEKLANRISAIRGVRNNTYHEYVPQMIALVND
ncbi:MAG: HEAT repeat domain-containing protein, partial [Alistipes sp.]|nr:HEAT repeat domain-containing protein [Alistipes sp.]